jgi:UV DNA damage endonuclease
MVRLGLCCTFLDAPIKFRQTTVRYASTLTPSARLQFLNEIAVHNAHALGSAIEWCAANGIGAFRVLSQLLPLYTHPEVGWTLASPTGRGVREILAQAGARRAQLGVRLSFHPDQFVVPGSVNPATVTASIAELEYMAEVAELIGAEQLTIHGGGAQGGKASSLERLASGLAQLSPRARALVVLENDDRVYTVEDLLPLCRRLGIPLIYDVHHHRCNPDTLSVEQATDLAAATWGGREPWAHLSSPAVGWTGGDPRPHADYIAESDVPATWLARDMTVDIEAKAKERAVLTLQKMLAKRPARVRTATARTDRPAAPATPRPGRARPSAATRTGSSARGARAAARSATRAPRTSGRQR